MSTTERSIKLRDGHTYVRRTVSWRTAHNTMVESHSYSINGVHLGWQIWEWLHREIDEALFIEDAMRAAGHAPTLEEIANVA